MIRSCLIRALTVLSLATGLTAAKPLEVWIMPNGANPQGILEQRISLFEKETGIKTQVKVLDWGEAWSHITTALEGKAEAPAVLQLGTTWVSYFASRGQLAKLDAYLADIHPQRFSKVSWKTTGTDGDLSTYSIPWFIDARALMVNKTILQKAKVSAEDVKTYQGFYQALKKINNLNLQRNDGSKVRAFAFPGKNDWNIPHNFAPWIWSAGGSFVSKDENGSWHSNLLDPKTIEGIANYLNFVLDSLVDKVSLRDNTAQVVQHFNNGELAFILNTAELVMQIRFDASVGGLATSQIGTDGISIMPVPSGKAGSVCFIGGSNLAIPASQAKNANAVKLLKFLTRDDNLDAYTKQIGFLPPVERILNSWAKDSTYKILIDHLNDGRSYPNIPEWTLIEVALGSLFSDIWSYLDVGGLYSEEAMYSTLLTYNQKINDILHAPASTTPPMQLDEFLDVWKKSALQNHGVSSSQSESDTISSDQEKNSAPIGLTVFLFLIALFSGFIATFIRKRKK
jgi:multiple sugar transport system substrate-binding protein